MRILPLSVLVMLVATSSSSAGAALRSDGRASPQTIEEDITRQLVMQFGELTVDPNDYRERVSTECSRLPDNDVLPYVLPAMAYANLAIAQPHRYRDLALRRIPPLLDLAIEATARRVQPPSGDLARLRSYRFHAVHLGQLNMAVGAYRLIGGNRYADLHATLTAVLYAALATGEGRPLRSYPTTTRPFDTLPVLVSLHLHDLCVRQDRSRAAIDTHLTWIRRHATDAALGLPWTRIDGEDQPAPPRGSDLSWRIALLAHLDARAAAELYDAYSQHYWLEKVMKAGFAEWPPEQRDVRADGRSGPVVLGIGQSASLFGLAAAAAAGDDVRRGRLLSMLPLGRTLLRTLLRSNPDRYDDYTLGGLIDPASDYRTGMLYGDAQLFYAITWVDWSRRPDLPPAENALPVCLGPPVPENLDERLAAVEPVPPGQASAAEPLQPEQPNKPIAPASEPSVVEDATPIMPPVIASPEPIEPAIATLAAAGPTDPPQPAQPLIVPPVITSPPSTTRPAIQPMPADANLLDRPPVDLTQPAPPVRFPPPRFQPAPPAKPQTQPPPAVEQTTVPPPAEPAEPVPPTAPNEPRTSVHYNKDVGIDL